MSRVSDLVDTSPRCHAPSSRRRDPILRVARVIAVASLVVTLGACGGGSQAILAASELPVITEAPSRSSDGTWRELEDYANDPHDVTLDLFRTYWTSPAGKAAVGTFGDAGFRRGYWKYWTGRVADGEADAEIMALLFRDDSGASSGLAALQEFWRQEPPADFTETVDEIATGGLADESWGLRFTGGDATVAYGLRVGNLVVVLRITCDDPKGCSPPVAVGDAAHAYAEEVAARAESALE